ncbi:molybdopterin-guanine dinucleotide biosynthesis protein B [Oceanobacillus oncorhynchi]|uniref:molybdopterin-guanine dinucleotide biosynthesis protein B n=1 Tax=Oceanobacillus oncorhynchi TaxID=545501 RepID=UPI002116B105|nr:molybdopterin-guanine dinucleotide biosynthesis protein B [Oceanobacillus oncorhynchi]UUI39389.1 molybdopterin-guanine dinucleotide biosynthesis protein B [Oceanobacillus oncorhynchi]
MDIIQVVGYKNSGKTSLACKLIEHAAKKGFRTASLKHHGHGGVPEGISDTDSEKHKQAGSLISGVEGDGVFQLSKENWTLYEMIQIYEWMQINLLIIEGFKAYSFPKVVLISDEKDLELLDKVENVKAIIARVALEKNAYPFPVFQQHDYNGICKWLEEQLKKKA